MAELEEVILYVIHAYVLKTSHGISRVRLMKLLFLVDYKHLKRHGIEFTNVAFQGG